MPSQRPLPRADGIAPDHTAPLATAEGQLVNAFSIDVEDYFQVSAFAPFIDRASWDTLPCRVERNVDRILQMLADAEVKATFFTLGWIAQRYPGVVRRMVEDGHEVASHGYGHLRATDQSPADFLADIRSARSLLEDIAGQQVKGYRAPSFSVGKANPWAFDCMATAGYQYSSSIYPIRHDHYGVPDAPRFAHRLPAGLLEIPISTVNVWNANRPAGGGGYFRLLPYALSRWSIRRINAVDRQPAVFYFHPWEIDPGQPRPAGVSAKSRFRHYVNLSRMDGRLRLLLKDFRWGRMDQVFQGDLP